jgi:hypothetical protein
MNRLRSPIALCAWLSVAALALGFVIGRDTAPEAVRVEERVKVVEVTKEVLVVREKLVEAKETHKAAETHTRRRVVEKTSPDGTTERRIDEETGARSTESTVEVRYVDRVVEKFVDREVKVEAETKVEKVQPDWNVAATLGVAPLTLNPLAIQESLVLGVEVRRRIIGPVSVGLWGQTNATFGLSLSLDL